ncbi:hypothetical protein V8C35DRAFT_279233 [Trichoderma chlorosporum]
MPIISTIDEESLMNQGLLGPVDPDGTRRIHRRRLTWFSDAENQHLPLTPLSEASSQSDPDLYAVIPAELISQATIRYLGYNDETAAEIWHKWSLQAPDHPIADDNPPRLLEQEFIDYVTGYSYNHDSDTYDDDDTRCYITIEITPVTDLTALLT